MRYLVLAPAKVRVVEEGRRNPVEADEHGLVMRAKAGDRSALGTLLSRHGPRIYRCVLLPRLGNEARARDALSATYERAIEKLSSYEWQSCGIYPWLRVVALRIALDQIRARRHEVLFSEQDLAQEIDGAEAALCGGVATAQGVEDQHDMDQTRRRVHDALAKINPRYAEAIKLRVLEDRPREQVAEQLGVTASTFDVLLHRALAALKKALGSDEREQES
jgi:RNA polymerase sigma-70 factor (ECF subfamily)